MTRDINRILSLASIDEIETHSPDYFQLIQSQDNQWEYVIFPIPDFQIPSDKFAFINLLNDGADLLRHGGNLLVHCQAGIGRTGTYAICQLLALGFERDEAQIAIKDAGSFPETDEQMAFVQSISSHF